MGEDGENRIVVVVGELCSPTPDPREGWQRTETNRRLLVIMRTPTVRIALYGPRRGLLHRHL